MYLIPYSPKLMNADKIYNETGREFLLAEALKNLNFEYIIIDTPPTLNILTINALTASNKVIIPTQADSFSIQRTWSTTWNNRSNKKIY